jgi:hypothetical protein
MQGRTDLFDDPRSGRPLHNDLADPIRAMIQEFTFASCKHICTRFRLVKRLCLYILHNVLHLKKFNLQWVPHSLDDAQNAEQLSLSTDFLRVIKENQKNGFAQVRTGDELWFYFD